jgi:hypothetical protein
MYVLRIDPSGEVNWAGPLEACEAYIPCSDIGRQDEDETVA